MSCTHKYDAFLVWVYFISFSCLISLARIGVARTHILTFYVIFLESVLSASMLFVLHLLMAALYAALEPFFVVPSLPAPTPPHLEPASVGSSPAVLLLGNLLCLIYVILYL